MGFNKKESLLSHSLEYSTWTDAPTFPLQILYPGFFYPLIAWPQLSGIHLLTRLNSRYMDSAKIAIKTSRGIEFLRMEDILCCIAHGRYTKILTINGKEFLLTRVLKEIESCLPDNDFFRTHKSYLINLNHITQYQKNKETPITLVNGMKIQLAKRRKQDFHKRINEMVQTL